MLGTASGGEQGDSIVSVVIPSYNSGSYICQTIQSVVDQTYAPIEIVVVDGASTDGTVAILHRYGERYPDRFRWISEPDSGQSSALNKGFRMARGEFIAWQNADDYYLPHAFDEPVAYLRAHPDAAMTYSDDIILDGSSGRMRRRFCGPVFDYHRLMSANYIPSHTTLIRRSVLKACGGVAEDLHCAMDYDLWLRIGARHRIVYIPGARAVYRALAQSKSIAYARRTAHEATVAVERVLADLDLTRNAQERAAIARHQHLLDEMLVAVDAMADSDAPELLGRALDLSPTFAGWPVLLTHLTLTPLLQEGPNVALGRLLRLRKLFLAAGPRLSVELRQLTSLIHWYRAFENKHDRALRRVIAQAVRATVADRAVYSPQLATALVLRLLCGPDFVDSLQRCVQVIDAAHDLRRRLL